MSFSLDDSGATFTDPLSYSNQIKLEIFRLMAYSATDPKS